MFWTNLIGLGDEVGLDESVDRSGDEEEDDDAGDDNADDLEPLEPGLSAPAYRLEHAPETVYEVEPDGDEPNDIEDEDPPFAERGIQQEIGVVLIIAHTEHLGKLHLGPEMGEVEADETEDDNAEDEHILGGPGISFGLAGHFIALPASAGFHILPRQPAAIDDMDQETEREDRDHDGDESGAHEVAAELEQAVSCGEELLVSSHDAVLAGERVDDREEVDSTVQQKEDDKESTTDALDEFLSDGGIEYEHFLRI